MRRKNPLSHQNTVSHVYRSVDCLFDGFCGVKKQTTTVKAYCDCELPKHYHAKRGQAFFLLAKVAEVGAKQSDASIK